jgi:calcium-translocating P-type ATPase
MPIHQLSIEDALASLGSSLQGLSHHEAARRLKEYGQNQVEAAAREHWTLRLGREFAHFFAIILWIAAGLSFIAEWSAPGQGMDRLGFVIIGSIVISGLFSFWQEYRVEQTIAALRKLLPRQVTVLREGEIAQCMVEQLVPGDIVLLEQGDHIPADCRLIEAFGVRVNNATVTGESTPQACEAAPASGDLLRSKNILLAGTALVSGQAKAVIFATGMNTEFGKIAHLTQTARETISPLRLEIAYLSRLIMVLALAIGLVFFVISWWAIGVSFWEAIIFAIGLIVAMVPEGLMPTLTLSLVLATQRMAKRNVLIRHLPSVETLGSTTVICTDKTGTLTQNRMTVRQLLLGDALHTPEQGKQLAADYPAFFATAALCHDLKQVEQVLLGDPTEVALVELAQTAMTNLPIWPRLDEIPFDTDRMRLSSIHTTPQGPMLYTKGAPESVLPLCSQVLLDGEVQPLTTVQRAKILQTQAAMAERGLRVLALAYRPLPDQWKQEQVEQELVFSGLAALEDPPRPEVPEALRKCREAGIKVIMVTGDHPRTAQAVAREIGLVQSDHPVVITGDTLRSLSDTQLRLALDAPEILFARVGADQKLRIVEALKHKQHVVAVTGDGVNDAPALKSAHIGIAMGLTGTDVAREAADMVLLDDNFASIVNAIEEGRAVFENIRKFLTYILAHNVSELIPYLGFALFKIPIALTPIQILAIDMGTDSLTALGLGVEKPDPAVMQQPPRSRNQRLLDLPLALRAYLFLGLIEAAIVMTTFFYVLRSAGWHYGTPLASTEPLYLQATTATLSAIVVVQIVNVFLCRSTTQSAFSSGLRSNPLILWGVAAEIAMILAIDYTPWGNALFGTAPIALEVWLFILPFAAGMLAMEEGRKWVVRRVTT